MDRLTSLFPILLVGTSVSLLSTLAMIYLAPRLKFIDLPGTAPHKIHVKPVALGGGVSIFLSITCTLAIFGTISVSILVAFLAGGLIIMLWGILDDVRNLRVLEKLLGQIIAAGVMVYGGVRVNLVGSDWMNIGLSVLWILAILNAYNFVDSQDGLAVGLGGTAASFFMLVTIESQQPELSILSAGVLGACIGLYLFNAPPARIFLGDSGSQLIGFLLAGLSIAYNPIGLPQGVSWFVPILLMAVPIFDMSLVVISRLINKKPVYQAGIDHTFHRLVRLGLGPNRAVVSMHMASILLGLLAFLALTLDVYFANALFGVILIVGILSIYLLELQERRVQS